MIHCMCTGPGCLVRKSLVLLFKESFSIHWMQCTFKGHSDRESESFADRQLRIISTDLEFARQLQAFRKSWSLIGLRVPAQVSIQSNPPLPPVFLARVYFRIRFRIRRYFRIQKTRSLFPPPKKISFLMQTPDSAVLFRTYVQKSHPYTVYLVCLILIR